MNLDTTMTRALNFLFIVAAQGLAGLFVALSPAVAQGTSLAVSDDGHSLVTRQGKPFFYLADTAWELLARLNRDEAIHYLDDRKAKGFTVIQTAFLALHQGPNALGQMPVIYKRLRPITTKQAHQSPASSAVSIDWWDHADFIIREATARGFYLAIAPFRQQLAPKKMADAVRYGRFLGRRYRQFTNIIWSVGFDPSVEQIDAQQNLYRALAQGIAQGVSGRKGDYGPVFMTFHPSGPNASSRWFHDDAFLDFNLIQTGHGRNTESWKLITADYEKKPPKPVLDAEATYEAHPLANVRDAGNQKVLSDDSDIRKYAYWNLFAGACGHTYGHHSVWQMHQPERGGGYGAVASWSEALDAPGAGQMRHVRTLMESRPFLERLPDQTLLADTLSGANHSQALRGRSYAFVYSPQGHPFSVVMGKITGQAVQAHWFDPRTGRTSRIGEFANEGILPFTPPTSGRENDWVLVLDDTGENRSAPSR